MLKVKESVKNHQNQLERWLHREDYAGRKGIDLVKKYVTFVNGTEEADIGISWHGNVVYGVPKEKCILMKNEPPIYNCFFNKKLNDPKYKKDFLAVMASNKTDANDHYYNIPRHEYMFMKEHFDVEKDKFLCTILRNKRWSYWRNYIDLRNRKYNQHTLLNFRKKGDIVFSKRFKGKYQSYGGPWVSPTYYGKIPGDGISLYDVLSHYKLCFAPENSRFWGYVCEKAFQAMCCGSVPIYYGAPDVEYYYPKGTFIDCREFKNFGQLCDYIQQLKDEDFEDYRKKMKRFLTTNQSEDFSSVTFAKRFLKVLGELKLV